MFLLSLLFSFSVLADTRIALPGIHPNGIAPSTNGAFWVSPSVYSNEIALVQADGSFERVKIEAPLPFGNDRHAPMLGLRDGSLVVASFNGMLAHVRTNLEYTVYRLPDPAPLLITDLALGADGTIWYTAYSHSFGKLVNGEITQYQLPVSLGAVTTAPDGSVYIASFEGIYRAAANGEIEAIAPCPVQYCDASWIEVTPDGTILSSMGRVPPGGTLVRADIRAVDSTIDADGNAWLAPNDNVIRRIAPDGSMREVWLHDPGDRPTAIVFARGALWFSIPEAIESRDPETELDLDLRAGDLVTHDEEDNCCFEGTHPVLAFHRRGDDGFSRRIDESCGAVGDEEGCFPYNSVLVPNPARVWFEYAGSIAAIALDQSGRLTNTLEGIDRANPSGMVVDRTGAIYALQDTYAERRLLHFAPDGTLVSNHAIAIDGARAIDLAADQCTLYYAGHGVGRVNVCTGALLAQLTNEIASDVRILHGGDVLVATRARVIRFTPGGAIVREYPGGYSIALDLDPRFIWIGGDDGVSRVNLENGEIVEHVATYGPTVSVAVVGEVRAARVAPRRSAVRH